jgi:hypothetical protein
MNHVEIKNYQLKKKKKVYISESNTSFDFNDEILNLKEHPHKSPRVEAEDHHFKTLIVESQKLKLMIFYYYYFKLRLSYFKGKISF